MPVSVALHDVRVRYGPVEALHGVSLAFPSRAVTAVLGRNGAGRSTLLRTIAGLVAPSSGRIVWDGVEITRRTVSERARDGLALIPDGHGVFAGLPVRDNLRVFAGGDGIDPALDAFPVLRTRLGRRAGTLSGGEQQMLAVSRALLRPSRVLLLDELSQGLAPRVVAQLYEVVTELAADDRTVVLVEQYAGEALRLADVAYVLRRGRVAFAGEPGELLGASDVSLFE